MNAKPRSSGPVAGSSLRTTAGSTPSLQTAVLAMFPGKALDELAERSVLRCASQGAAPSLSASWDGARQLVTRLNSLGCSVETEIHADRCVCRIQRLQVGEEAALQLARVEARNLPEAVAKASILACLLLEAKSQQPPDRKS